ncbi:hypothetical protein [Arthrobacter sp. SLBN-112]|uniref:hypothetical protein n=1 Tax=Arthrobacter sp. SLBN-112 TaxID=2768452 RepID=UPI001152B916|nr:hypothetical protein [Arthrobacter sp. SLBN-112]
MTNEEIKAQRKIDMETTREWGREAPARQRGDFSPEEQARKAVAYHAAQERLRATAKDFQPGG